MNRCDICLDEKCGKIEENRTCNCKNCSNGIDFSKQMVYNIKCKNLDHFVRRVKNDH